MSSDELVSVEVISDLPEKRLPSYTDATSGLDIDIVSSTEDCIGLQVRLVEEPDADVIEYDGLDFETSRAALARAPQKR